MKQKIIISIINFSFLATIPAWGQTNVIRREINTVKSPVSSPKKKSLPSKKTVPSLKKTEIKKSWNLKGDITENMAWVRDDNGKYGFIDQAGELVIPCKWNNVKSFCDGFAAVRNDDGKWGYVDKSGSLVIPCTWNDADSFSRSNKEARVKDDNNMYCYIDQTGVIVRRFSIRSFRLLETDLTANVKETRKQDINGETAALIKVVTNQTGFFWDGGALGIVGTQQMDGEIWVYVPRRAQRMTIKHPQLGTLKDFYYPISIVGGRTYEMTLDCSNTN